MRRKRTAVVAGLGMAAMLAGICSASAALPPYWQRAREIERIVGDQGINEALDSSPIVSIAVTGEDIYEVRSETCRLTVTIVDVPQDEAMMGPRKFDLELGQAECQ
ncbi:hypothetical protein [Bauldia litoralis]|uniref:hypothetical protein n=1 Tax=Bauldia litoralis TaxID=665467 RepID=UPI003263D2F8